MTDDVHAMSKNSNQHRSPRRLIQHDELPAWAVDNEFIVRGYRAPGGTRSALKARKAISGIVATSNGHNGKPAAARQRKARKSATLDDDDDDDEIDDIEEHDSFARCWQSVWLYAHNETVNIHTHLWGAIVAVASVALHVLGAYDKLPTWLHPITHHAIFYPAAIVPIIAPSSHSSTTGWAAWRSLLSTTTTRITSPPPLQSFSINHLLSSPSRTELFPWSTSMIARANDYSDWLGFASYLAGAITVLGCSATFHTVACHSQGVARAYNKLDYIGIVAMIVGSFLPMVHYGFYCHARLQHTYSAMIVILGAAAAYTVLSKKFTSPAYRPIRTSVFIALGLSAIVPVTHIMVMYGYSTVSRTMGLNYLIAGGALYIVGACLYMARIPERFAPGTFDYVGASHQLFHVFILVAAFCHYVCLRRSHIFWHSVQALDSANSSNHLATQAVCAAFQAVRHGRRV